MVKNQASHVLIWTDHEVLQQTANDLEFLGSMGKICKNVFPLIIFLQPLELIKVLECQSQFRQVLDTIVQGVDYCEGLGSMKKFSKAPVKR